MKISTRRNKPDEKEYISLSNKNKRYKIKNPFSEEVTINGKKTDIKIFENENGFTYILWKKKKYLAEIIEKSQNKYVVLINGVSYNFSVETPISYKRKKYLDKQKSSTKSEVVEAPMPGKILEVLIEENTQVKEGDPLLILEAMKMQNEISSPISGKIKKVFIKQNDTVLKDDMLIEISK
jgi:biotin carboxyl carrier protein